MIGVIQQVESLQTTQPVIITGSAGQTKDTLKNRKAVYSGQIGSPPPEINPNFDGKKYVHRFIQNVGADTINFALSFDASADQYHGQIAAGIQLSVNTLERVTIWCATAWKITMYEQYRDAT